jgi:hypothetical protein
VKGSDGALVGGPENQSLASRRRRAVFWSPGRSCRVSWFDLVIFF